MRELKFEEMQEVDGGLVMPVLPVGPILVGKWITDQIIKRVAKKY